MAHITPAYPHTLCAILIFWGKRLVFFHEGFSWCNVIVFKQGSAYAIACVAGKQVSYFSQAFPDEQIAYALSRQFKLLLRTFAPAQSCPATLRP